MDRRLGIGLAVALGVALLAIAFLLGRESQRGAPAGAALTPAPGSPAPGIATDTPIAAPGEAVSTGTSAPIGVATPAHGTRSPSPEPSAAPVSSSETTSDPQRAEVARYLAEVEALQRASKAWTGDANAAAQQLLEEAVGGDTGGLKAMADANRQLAQQLRALSVPAPCATHHQKTLEVLDLANRLLDKMQTSVVSADPAVLGALATQGQDVEKRAREVDALADALKQRYKI